MPDKHNWLIIVTTILGAFVLTLLPMPGWTVWLRPAWVMLILIYWSMTIPYRVGVAAAWFTGIFLDVLNGTLLGEHALAFAIVIYLVVRSHSRLLMFPLLQQGLLVFLFILLYQFIVFCIQGFLGDLPTSWLYWLSAVTSMLLWPWVFTIMHDCQSRFTII